MSNRPVNLLLSDILESIERIFQYIKGLTFEDFSNDRKSIDALSEILKL